MASTLTFKTDCPKCRGHKKIVTKAEVASYSLLLSKATCHKCGLVLPKKIVRTQEGVSTDWCPPDPEPLASSI